MNKSLMDPVSLTQKLVQCQSVTPNEGGAIQTLEELLKESGFECIRVDRNGIANLVARFGDTSPIFGFNGHTDTVPVGNSEEWTCDPFGGEIKDGKLWGRGSTDMKSGVAAFVSAAIDFVKNKPSKGSLVITITGDEEAQATDGSAAIVDWMNENNLKMDVCLVGEPTCPKEFGEEFKIGRRGSLSIQITMHGVQGHSAYPNLFVNPIKAMVHLGHIMSNWELDKGTKYFQPSIQTLTSFETGNITTNVVPAECTSIINLRFNDLHTISSLTNKIKNQAEEIANLHDCQVEIKRLSGAESFYTSENEFTKIVSGAVKKILGIIPKSSTLGGTSDARFFAPLCDVVEFGLVGKMMHQVDEHVAIDQIVKLKQIYQQILNDYFQA